MNKLISFAYFIQKNRKTLISILILVGLISSLFTLVIFQQRSQTIRSEANSTPTTSQLLNYNYNFISPNGYYKLSYDPRYWSYSTLKDDVFGSRTIFSLNYDFGSARIDIIEGRTELSLDELKNEIIKKSNVSPFKSEKVEFRNQLSYLLTYKEQTLGYETYYYKRVIKENNIFLIIEEKVPQMGYNSEYVGNLLQNISFVDSETQTIKGISDFNDSLTTAELADLIRPSVANIIYIYCLQINNLKPQLSQLLSSNYKFCGFGKGSGFIVSEEGIIATNGHVVKIYPEEALITNLLYSGNKTFNNDLIRTVYLSKGQNPTVSQIEDFYKELQANPQYLDLFLINIFKLIKDEIITLDITHEKYYVNIGGEPVRLNYEKLHEGDYEKAIIPSKTTFAAHLLDYKYPNKYSYEAIVNKNYTRGEDVALLRLDSKYNYIFPTLSLTNMENLREGIEIVVAGYPTIVEGETDPRGAISFKTSNTPTITRGIISSVKEDLSGKKILQTDASIDHGSSGGPAIRSNADVIGIATFAVDSKTGNFNFLRSIAELNELMLKNNINNSKGTVTNSWVDGLVNFRNRRFKTALKHFNNVKSLNPSHPTINSFIEHSENATLRGESTESIVGYMRGDGSNILLVIFGIFSVVSFMSAGFLASLPLFAKVKTQQ